MRDVVEDVKRLGGFGIAAHPDSPKPELQWKDWIAPFDGLEIINLDTAWRQKVTDTTWRPKAGLAARLLTYPFRPAESITGLISRSSEFYRWDALSRRRHVVTVPGADAHAQIAWRASDPIAAKLSVPVPSYEAAFRTLSMRVRPDRPLTGTAATDAALIFHAIRAGHLYTVIDGAATPPSFEFTASNTLGAAGIGDQVAPSGPVALHVRSNAPDGFTTTIWRGVDPIASDRTERDITVTATAGAGVYWVEIHAAGQLAAVPWITSNAIYVRPLGPPAVIPARAPARTSRLLFDGRSTETWRVVTDATSLGALDMTPTTTVDNALRLRFGLSTSTANQFVALSVATPQGVASNDRLSFSTRAEKPMRISVQLQTEKARWQRSVYVDTDTQAHTIFFKDFVPIGETESYRPPLADVRNVLFVIDATNTKPGASGRLWIASPALQGN